MRLYSYCRAGLSQGVMSACAVSRGGEQRANEALRVATGCFCYATVTLRVTTICGGTLCVLTPPTSEFSALTHESLEHESREGLILILHQRRRLYRGDARRFMQLSCQPSIGPSVRPGRGSEPARLCHERAEPAEDRCVREHKLLAEVVQHPLPVVTSAEFQCSHAHECAHVPTEALWGRVIEMVGDVRDREAWVLEQPGGTHEPCEC
jgi:hypothetical protein